MREVSPINPAGPTILSLRHHDMDHQSTLPWDANMEDILQAVYGLCIAATWNPILVLECMKQFAEEQLEAISEMKEIDE